MNDVSAVTEIILHNKVMTPRYLEHTVLWRQRAVNARTRLVCISPSCPAKAKPSPSVACIWSLKMGVVELQKIPMLYTLTQIATLWLEGWYLDQCVLVLSLLVDAHKTATSPLPSFVAGGELDTHYPACSNLTDNLVYITKSHAHYLAGSRHQQCVSVGPTQGTFPCLSVHV